MKTILKYIILFLIQTIERWEYRNLDLDEDNVTKKIIDSLNLDNFYVDTPEGWSKISQIHKTQPYTIWKIKTEKGLKLECADKHILFDSTNNEIFVKNLKIGHFVQTKTGLDKIVEIKKLPFKVSMYDLSVDNLSHTYYSNEIKSHNTTTIAAYFAWYMCFHNDRNLAILANKQATAFEIVNKVTDVFKGLPFFLKPGIVNIGAGGMRLDNGCFLTSQATTKTAQIGFTIHVLYADEFAHIQPSIVDSFWRSIYPTLASSDISQCIISSTPNGQDNLFFEIWDKSQKNINEFMSIRVDWWEVPGHDEAWAEKMRRNFGEDRFNQEFGLDFNTTGSNLLFGGSLLAFIKKIEKEYTFHDLGSITLDEEKYRNLKWHPAFDPNIEFNTKEHRFIISIDTGEGRDEDETKDNDYNVANIFKVELKSLSQLKKLKKDELHIKNMFRLVQVGLYRDNIKDEVNCANVTKSLIYDQFKGDICKILIEMNFNGKLFLDKFSQHPEYDDYTVVRTYHTKPIPGEKLPPKKPGFKVTADKDFFCKLSKRLATEKTIVLNEIETAKEFRAFGKIKSKWKGIGTHDDIAMSALNIGRLYEEIEYEEWLFDFLDEMPDSIQKRFVLNLLEQYQETSDIDDKTFSSLYGNTQENVNPFVIAKQNSRYNPSSSVGRSMPTYSPSLPWKNV